MNNTTTNNDNINNNNMITITPTPPDLQLCPSSPDPHHIFHVPAWNVNNIHPITTITPNHHNPRKKRTKMVQFHNTKPILTTTAGAGSGSTSSSTHSGVVTKKKPDPSAPKITRPCTECGKRFWSWKALFGHMRCHPERPWRGINPPPNIHHPPPDRHVYAAVTTTEDDEYVAACLLMLANTPTVLNNVKTTAHASTSYQHHCGPNDVFLGQVNDSESRFECSSCKKVFGSHQALGGHRASHKNVKGCFANTRNDAGTGTGTEELEYGDYSSYCDKSGEGLSINQQHKCSICLKIFASGQALGGHKRCHLEKEDGVVPIATATATATTSILSQPFRFDLNFPAPRQDDSACSSSDLDLRLRL